MRVPIENVQWIHGAANCALNSDPPIQIHELDEATFIMRVSKCFSYEGNFLYLLFGNKRAILFDTGGPPDRQNVDTVLPVRSTVDRIVASYLQSSGLDGVDLIVAHTHSHTDHAFWDGQFTGRPRTIVVEPTLQAVKSFYQLPNWPEGQSLLDLGARILTVLPLPGHEPTHIAIFDSRTKSLLTGDALYPGLLTVPVRDWATYRKSAARLAAFARDHEISAVLGNHIEMKTHHGELYEIGTTYQPEERALPLTASHIQEWHLACEAMGNSPHRDIHDDFIIGPLG